MDGFPRYELFGSEVARKFDYFIQDSKCGDPSQQQSEATKDSFWDGGDSSLYDDLHKVHLREKPDWLVTMSLPDTDELFGFYFRRSYADFRTAGLANRDLSLQEVSGCDSSECSQKSDSDRRRKTMAFLVLGIGALGILAGIIAVIFIMIISRPPDPITGGFVNITNPSHEGNYTTQSPSHGSDLHSGTQPLGLVTNTVNIGRASTATLTFSPEVFAGGLVTNNSSRLGSHTAPSLSTELSGGMDPLIWRPASTLTKTTAISSETRIPEFSSTLQTSWPSLETGFAMTISVTPTIGNTVDTLLPPGISNTIITSVPPSERSTVTTSEQSRNASTFTTPVSLATENANTTLVTTSGYTKNISSIVTAAGRTVTLYPKDNTIITSAKLVSENIVIASAAMPTAYTVITSVPLTTENSHFSSVMANTIVTSPSLATKNTNISSKPQVTENTLVSSIPKISENTVTISTLLVSENTGSISVPTTAVNAMITLVAPLSGDGSAASSPSETENAIGTSTSSTTGKTVSTVEAQISLVLSTSVGGTLFEVSPLTSDVPNNKPPYASPTPVVTATPATATLPVTLFSSDPDISERISSNLGFPGGMSSNIRIPGGISPISTAVNRGSPAAATMTPSTSVTWSTVMDGSSGMSDVVLTLMSAVTGSSITTGTATQRPDTSTRTTVGTENPATTTTTSGSPSLSFHIATTPSIVTNVSGRTVTPPTSAAVTLPSAASATAMSDTIIYTPEQSTLASGLQQTTTKTDLITTTSMPFTTDKIVSLATGPSTPGIAATPVVTTVLPSTVVSSVVTVVSEERVTPAATATSTTARTTTTTAVLPASQTSSAITTLVPFINSAAETAAVRETSSTASLTTSIPASTAGRLATTDHSSSPSLGPPNTVSASLLPSMTSETMRVSDSATRLLPTIASATRLAPVSTNTVTATTFETSAETNGIRQTMTPTTLHTSMAASTSTIIASTNTPNPTAIPNSIISPTTSPSTSNPTIFPSLLSTMPTLTKSLALTTAAISTTELSVPTAVLRTSSSLNVAFSTAVVVTTIISSSPPTTPSSSSLALTSTAVTTSATSVLTSTTALVTTTMPSTTTPPKSEIIFTDTVLQLYQPGVLSCTHIGNDWSFVVLLRNDTETIAGYQNVFGCTQMVGCNTFLNNVDLQETNVGFNNTFTLTFNNVSCSDQRLYTCQEVIVGLTASAFVKVEVPKSLQKLEISVPSTIRSTTPTSISCSARLEAESGAVFWEIAGSGNSTFVPVVLTSASGTETRLDECLRDVTLRARHTFSASQKGAKLRCRTISPDAVSPEIVLNIV